MWFVFPQLAGLGRSSTARHFALRGADEARAYLDHPVLGPRLRECAPGADRPADGRPRRGARRRRRPEAALVDDAVRRRRAGRAGLRRGPRPLVRRARPPHPRAARPAHQRPRQPPEAAGTVDPARSTTEECSCATPNADPDPGPRCADGGRGLPTHAWRSRDGPVRRCAVGGVPPRPARRDPARAAPARVAVPPAPPRHVADADASRRRRRPAAAGEGRPHRLAGPRPVRPGRGARRPRPARDQRLVDHHRGQRPARGTRRRPSRPSSSPGCRTAPRPTAGWRCASPTWRTAPAACAWTSRRGRTCSSTTRRRCARRSTRSSRTSPTSRSARRLVLWHGAPGTGKTSAVRALMHAWQGWARPVVVTDPERLLTDGRYLRRLLLDVHDEVADDGEDRWQLLVLEDAEALLRKDTGGPAMSRLLNLTDGLLGQGLRCLFLITTNEPLAAVHPAVVRPGRCLAQVEFGPLPAAQASALLGRPVSRADDPGGGAGHRSAGGGRHRSGGGRAVPLGPAARARSTAARTSSSPAPSSRAVRTRPSAASSRAAATSAADRRAAPAATRVPPPRRETTSPPPRARGRPARRSRPRARGRRRAAAAAAGGCRGPGRPSR